MKTWPPSRMGVQLITWPPNVAYVRSLRSAFAWYTRLDGDCWNPGVYRPGFKIASGDGAQAEHRTLTHIHSWRNRRARTHPAISTEAHRKRDERKRWIVVVMRSAANVSLLRNDGVRSHLNGRGIVDLRMVAQGHAVCAQQIPRGPDARLRIKMAMRSQLSSETAQQQRAPGMERSRRCAVQKRPADGPNQAAQPVR